MPIANAQRLKRIAVDRRAIQENFRNHSLVSNPLHILIESPSLDPDEEDILRSCIRLEIDGPSTLEYNPHHPVHIAHITAVVWLETTAPVSLFDSNDLLAEPFTILY